MPRPPAPDLADLIRRCFSEWSDQKFDEFCSALRPCLEAALRRFITGRELVAAICRASFVDYHRAFKSSFRPKFDYEAYFLAIAYSQVVRVRGDWGV